MGDVAAIAVVVAVALVVAAVAMLARGRRRAGAPGPGPSAPGGGAGGQGDAGGTPPPLRPPVPGAGAPAAGPAPGGRPGPAGEVVGPTVERAGAPSEATLAQLLAGVALPCGLAPVAAGQADPERYLALLTADAGPDDVGPALADELERLGYALHSLSQDEAVARRGADLLSLRLHPRADQATAPGGPRFPGAAPGAVGVELWVGAGPNPRG